MKKSPPRLAFDNLSNTVKRWIAPPDFAGDEEKSGIAGLLNLVILISLLMALLSILGMLLGNNIPTRTLLIAIFWSVVLVQSRRWLLSGKLTLVGLILTIAFFVAITAANISQGSIRSTTTSIYIFWVALVAVLYRLPGLVIATSASSLAVLGLIWGEKSGFLPQAELGVGLRQWIVLTSLIALNATLAYYTNQITRRALARAENEIKQRKQSEMDLHKAKQEAEAANSAKSEFLANMSHELRTPMNGVLGMAQLLQMPGLTEEDRIDYAGVVISSGNVLMALLNDILDLSKIEAGKVLLESVPLDPVEIMRDVKALFSENARNKRLPIACEWRGAPVHYLGDSRRVNQMLSNLVSNSIKFTTQGSIQVEARELECSEQTALLEFAVTDTGIGIAEDKLHLLFQTFSQVDTSTTRTFGGTGLGLSIVQKLAALMGGEVGVESKVGQGSRFWFRLRVERIR
jgi:signal transduction histidine kinase